MGNKFKTLYITDLDGTLLRNDATVSDYTADVINRLKDKGILFTYATARAFTSASKIVKRITPRIPAVVYNGTLIVDGETGERLSEKSFTAEEKDYIIKVFADHGICPIVYAIIDGKEKYSFSYAHLPRASKIFVDSRSGDPRENDTDLSLIGEGRVIHFSCLADDDVLSRIRDIIEKDFVVDYFMDRYVREMFLEVHANNATKALGVLELKERLGCDRVVCFGDSTNDISMFEIADECYAVANAKDELKRIATGIIGDNESDGVARFLEEKLL